MNFFSKATLGLVAGATALTVAAPAEAQYRYRHHNRGGDVATGALIGGVAGLALGAAIASNNRGGYYDRGYYDRGYYDGPRYRHAPRRYYNPRRAYRQQCVRRVYDPYIGRRVRVRYC